ncbi:MAG: tRNA-dihydrouridine synthase [Methanobrevibacter sp.]|nr:tRNA-dihydrouridine synthase [Methanobrevibacter sp.]
MAGITDGSFALKLIPYGFDTVSIGGYNTDDETIAAGLKILQRGRTEFHIKKENLKEEIEKEINIIKNQYPQVKVSVNLRATSPDPIIDIIKIKNLDIIELNCHCRQEELLAIGCGQEMLSNPEHLNLFIKELAKKIKNSQKLSVKIRANVPNINTLNIAKLIEESGADYLHIDAMKPGKGYADLKIIEKIASETNIFIIGNNSITNIQTGKNMLNAGASGISIGRAAINGKLNFDLLKI